MQPTSYSSGSDTDSSFKERRRKDLMGEVLPEAELWSDDDRENEKETMDFAYNGFRRYCHCGQLAPRYTCMRIGKNAGRRYFGCQNWRYRRDIGSNFCNFFAWQESRFPPEAQEFVRYLMYRQEELKREVKEKENRNYSREIWTAVEGINCKLQTRTLCDRKMEMVAGVSVLAIFILVVALYFK